MQHTLYEYKKACRNSRQAFFDAGLRARFSRQPILDAGLLARFSRQPILDAGLLARTSGNRFLLQDVKDRIYGEPARANYFFFAMQRYEMFFAPE